MSFYFFLLYFTVDHNSTVYEKGKSLLLAYVYKLRPKQAQVVKMDHWLDMLRANYNWSLADRIDTYQQRFIFGEYCDLKTKSVASPLTCCVSSYGASGEPWRDNGKRRSAGEIQITALPELKKVRPWYKDVDSTVLQQNIKRLDKAFENFFVGRGFPKFKNRSTMRSFTFTTGVKLDRNKIYLPKLGWMRFYNSRDIPPGFKIKSVTVRKKADGYYISIRIEYKTVPVFPIKSNEEINTIVGLDMGLVKLVYCSDGSVIDNPRFATNQKTKHLQHIRQRRVSRKKKRSSNRREAQQKLSTFQHQIATRREAYQWQVAKKIVKKADAIAIEDLNISGMIKRCKPKYDQVKGRFLSNGQSAKRALSRSIADASWYALISKIEYMAAKSGKVVFKINPRHT
ncbi:MAG: transposase, partial [Calothrix sp. MO_192.B10]|nr:transposase [Calothrix sp. MO_192.B10]